MFSKGWPSAGERFLCGCVVAAALAACGEAPVSPLAAPDAAHAKLPAGTRPVLVSNAVKYRDRSAPLSTARSGSATLRARALLGRDGVTQLLVTTGDIDAAAAPGEIAKAQIRAFGAGGERLFVQNLTRLPKGGRQVFRLTGMARGARVEVQANVSGIDPRRTDVVTLTSQVRFAPLLGVQIQLPGAVQVGQPAVITGIVSEQGGDMGARADCVLYVDGAAVDRAKGIWVDAGDAVTCAFTYTFASRGLHPVEVRAVEVPGPGLQGTSVGDGGAVVATVGPPALGGGGGGSRPTYTASAETVLGTTSTVTEYNWSKPDGSFKQHSETNTTTRRSQSWRVDATLPRALQLPLSDATLTMISGGALWVDNGWTTLQSADTPQGCANRQMAEQGAMFWVCNAGQGATLGYTRFAGTVVYHSLAFGFVFDGATGVPNSYAWNTTTEESSGGTLRSLGASVDFSISVTDAQGTIGFSPSISLTPFSSSTETPESCVTQALDWLNGGTQTLCTSGSSSESGMRGNTSG